MTVQIKGIIHRNGDYAITVSHQGNEKPKIIRSSSGDGMTYNDVKRLVRMHCKTIQTTLEHMGFMTYITYHGMSRERKYSHRLSYLWT